MLARLRSRRLRWAGHILRSDETNLLRRVLLAQTVKELMTGGRAAGGLLMDVKFKTVEGLLELAQDRKGWGKMVRELLPKSERSVQLQMEEEENISSI